jgi:hypothetical protein
MHQSISSGVIFLEDTHPDAVPIRTLEVSIGGFMSHSQLKTLDDVKAKMAEEALQIGANIIVKFTYGQKAPGFWREIISLDNVHWYGTGIAAKIPLETYQDLTTNSII